jgi:hypothetical protein
VVTDAGPAYLKAINNPQGPHVLACDWIGTQLARRFGLKTFDVAILDIGEEDEIPIDDQMAQAGPSFVTRGEQGEPMSGEKALANVVNLEDIPRLIVFDTWVRNCDRYAPGLGKGGRSRRRLDNLFLSNEGAPKGKFVLKAIDHGHILTCGRELKPSLANVDNIRDDRLYGFFPFFEDHVTFDQILETGGEFKTVDPGMWRGLLESIPSAWQVSEATRSVIDRFLLERARFLVDNLRYIVTKRHPNQRILRFGGN